MQARQLAEVEILRVVRKMNGDAGVVRLAVLAVVVAIIGPPQVLDVKGNIATGAPLNATAKLFTGFIRCHKGIASGHKWPPCTQVIWTEQAVARPSRPCQVKGGITVWGRRRLVWAS